MKLYLCTQCGRKIARADLLDHRKTCGPNAEFNAHVGVAGHLGRFLKTAALLLGALLLAALSLFLGNMSFVRLTEMRQLERIPASAIVAILPGEVNLNGNVHVEKHLLSSPKTSTACVYYRYLVEREEKDSDGDTRWVTVSDDFRFVPFLLRDETGTVAVYPDAGVDFNVPESYQVRQGNMRYTEYRIDPGATLFAFGMAVANLEGMELRFDVQGHYKPILSRYGETSERVRMAGGSIAFCWGGLVVMAFALALLASVFRLHQLLSYFALLNTSVAVYLVVMGLNMMKEDLNAARERLLRHEAGAREALLSHLPSWDGNWESLPEDDAPLFQNLRPEQRARVSLIRIHLARAVERARRQRNAFPERLLAPAWRIPLIDPLPLPPFVRVQVDSDRLRFEKAKLPPFIGLGLIGASLLAGTLCYRAGFRRIRFKRCMENLPTSPSVGVAYGLSELKGVVETAPESDWLRAPLSQQPCVHYHYTIRERRGSGKKSHWVTVLDENRSCAFLCRDADGALPIDPQGAVFHTHHHSSRRSGNRVHNETRLEVGDPLYAIGEAVIDARRGDRLLLAKPGNDFPFILSNFTERRILLLLAFRGILLLNVSFSAILLSALLLFGLSGSYAATDYLASALVAPLFMTLVTLSLHYNDLVFLRERVRRNRANIDVALKKRQDLLPGLQDVTLALRDHERGLQEDLSRLRSLYTSPGGDTEPAIAESLGQLALRAEAYPDLRSQPLFAELMRTLIVLENEISFSRKGLNDAVETYNTRIQTLPDLLFAKLFHFRPEPFCESESTVIPVPPRIRDVWEKTQQPNIQLAPADSAETEPEALPDAIPLPLPAAPGLTLSEAKTTFHALLLSEDDATRGTQLQLIAARDGEEAARDAEALRSASASDTDDLRRLKQAESLYPLLRQLSRDDYVSWSSLLLDLMEADNVINLFEYALHSSLERHLSSAFGLAETPALRHRDYSLLLEPISCALSALARAGQADNPCVERVLAAGAAALNHRPAGDIRLLAAEACGIAALDDALRELAHASRMIRSNFLHACETAIKSDGDVPVEQTLMLCAVADVLRLPRNIEHSTD